MSALKQALLPLTLLVAAAALPALAASSASSAASEAGSTSVGSLSTSLQKSSTSSTGGNDKTAGDYRVIEVAQGQPGMVQLKLQALATAGVDGELLLTLPRKAADEGGVAAGRIVTATARPYGLEFADGPTRTPFFLVLDDAWHRELQTKVVTL